VEALVWMTASTSSSAGGGSAAESDTVPSDSDTCLAYPFVLPSTTINLLTMDLHACSYCTARYKTILLLLQESVLISTSHDIITSL